MGVLMVHVRIMGVSVDQSVVPMRVAVGPVSGVLSVVIVKVVVVVGMPVLVGADRVIVLVGVFLRKGEPHSRRHQDAPDQQPGGGVPLAGDHR